jgi:hypothetical protein
VHRIPLVVFAVVTAVFALWTHWPHSPLPEGVIADRIVVRKAARPKGGTPSTTASMADPLKPQE